MANDAILATKLVLDARDYSAVYSARLRRAVGILSGAFGPNGQITQNGLAQVREGYQQLGVLVDAIGRAGELPPTDEEIKMATRDANAKLQAGCH